MKRKGLIFGVLLAVICVAIIAILFVNFNIKKTSYIKEDASSDEWIVTQHGRNDINLSFYTIYNESKGLIVVDGGWTDDAFVVREVVDELGGHINAWILTHPHQDHIGAFNLLYNELEGITIDEIYTVDMATPEDCLLVAPWDNVDAYNDFKALDTTEITYVVTTNSIYNATAKSIITLKANIYVKKEGTWIKAKLYKKDSSWKLTKLFFKVAGTWRNTK